ncbi:IreB family regulatory phosphoprotein [Thermaerobacter sp. PB12/4term]|uniref:IreB family regulatory phosphoprotein n=1 Tax=Thermaerobacter sp. PB12/4term TaxID=2293838 RepID=UPI00193F6CFB
MEHKRDTGDEPVNQHPARTPGPAGSAGPGGGHDPRGGGAAAAGDEQAAAREPAVPPVPAHGAAWIPAVGSEGTRRLPLLSPGGGAALEEEERQLLAQVLAALRERGYDPARQLAHFLVTGEPAYITAHRGARVLIQKLDRVRVVEALVRAYLDGGFGPPGR